MLPFLAITIPWSPNLGQLGPFLITWHGLFTAVGILAGVQLSLWAGRRVGYNEDDAYTLALVGVPSGILGARLLFVAERWEYYSQNVVEIFLLNEGGISIWGAVLGGVLGSYLFALWRGYELRKGLDIASFGLILGMAIGRLGDLVNGEHLAQATSLPWAVLYTHPLSPAYNHSLTVGAHHPATTYEMLGDLVILGALFYFMFGPLRRRPGLTFFVFLISYSVMRYFVSMLRMDSADTVLPGATVPQLVSILVVLGSIPPVLWLLRQPPVDDTGPRPVPGRIPVRREEPGP
ncbi:MAG: prolipoprotein diacylglyceryl transferase [Dehalococcoidia bacterium]